MSLHDLPAPRKHRRLGLYIPFALAVLGVIAWSVFWLWARGEARARMDVAVADLRKAGYELSWKDRGLGGYPFRMSLTLTEARLRDPSGWALTAPKLEAEAFMHAPKHWMLATPDGLTFVRPVGGPVTVTGKTLVASLKDLDKRPASFSFSGSGLIFKPNAGAQPFALASAEKVEFHLRPGPDDEGGVFLRVDGGKASGASSLSRIAGAKPVALVWNSTLSKMSAFTGADWPQAVRNWSAAGGLIHVREGGLTAGDTVIGTKDARLGVAYDGRLSGSMETTLRGGPQALVALGQGGVIPADSAAIAAAVVAARQGTATQAAATVTFEAGQTTLGPVAVAPAPAVYSAR